MPTYEVFLSDDGRESFRHAGALDAPDDAMAVLYARETYIRRGEGSRAWVVARSHIVEVDPTDLAVTASRTQGRNDGKKIAERRHDRRAAAVVVGREVATALPGAAPLGALDRSQRTPPNISRERDAPIPGGNPPPSDAGRRSAPIYGGNLSPNTDAQQ